MPQFSDRLAAAVRRCGTPTLVGLDPRVESLPRGLRPTESGFDACAVAYRRFCRDVIDVVAGRVPAVKPQAAFFEQLGPAGMAALADVIQHARANDLLVILDGQRNDIGSTSTAYAQAYLGSKSAWGCDALTINPYLGDDSLQPFVDQAIAHDSGIFVLVKTSNPGGGFIQDLECGHGAIYERVADHIEHVAASQPGDSGYGSVGAVVGATYPHELAALRERMPHAWLLVPGFGAQGGGAADVAGAFAEDGLGALINSSRGIIFAHSRPPFSDRYGPDAWQRAVEEATQEMVEQLRGATAAGMLA